MRAPKARAKKIAFYKSINSPIRGNILADVTIPPPFCQTFSQRINIDLKNDQNEDLDTDFRLDTENMHPWTYEVLL